MTNLPRQPGDHLDEQIRKGFEWKFFYLGGSFVGVFMSACLVWVASAAGWKSLPGMMAGFLAASAVPLWWHWSRNKDHIRNLLRGLRAERTVGAILGDLGRMGYVAKHDIQCTRDGRTWNIDHLLIGPSGVYVIETKHRSKTKATGATIQFDGERITFTDGTWTTDPIEQVRRNVRDIRARLDGAGMRDVPVRGVVMFPGWSRVQGSSGKDIWVLMPSALEQWIRVEERKVARMSEERQRTVGVVVTADK